MPNVCSTYDERLARRIVAGEGREVQAATTFFERNSPVTFDDAIGMLEPHGQVTPSVLEHASRAWDVYWQLRDMPGD